MKKILIFAAIAAFALGATGCATLNNAELSPKMKNARLLPTLKPVMDETSFGSALGLTETVGGGSVGAGGTVFIGATTYANPALNDIDIIFRRDVGENICAGLLGKAKGTIRCRAVLGGSKAGGYGWMVASCLTLAVPTFVGMPIGNRKGELQVEVTVYDADDNLVGQYTSEIHNSVEYIAFYWGYLLENAKRKTARDNFTACMEDIKRQIAADYDRLNAALQ